MALEDGVIETNTLSRFIIDENPIYIIPKEVQAELDSLKKDVAELREKL